MEKFAVILESDMLKNILDAFSRANEELNKGNDVSVFIRGEATKTLRLHHEFYDRQDLHPEVHSQVLFFTESNHPIYTNQDEIIKQQMPIILRVASRLETLKDSIEFDRILNNAGKKIRF